jgi:hypothetical protein
VTLEIPVLLAAYKAMPYPSYEDYRSFPFAFWLNISLPLKLFLYYRKEK